MLIYASITRNNSQLCRITFVEVTWLERRKIVRRGKLIPTFPIISNRKYPVSIFPYFDSQVIKPGCDLLKRSKRSIRKVQRNYLDQYRVARSDVQLITMYPTSDLPELDGIDSIRRDNSNAGYVSFSIYRTCAKLDSRPIESCVHFHYKATF